MMDGSHKPHLNAKLLRRLFVAASICRWNDQACPIEFSELDKQAHKAMVVVLLAKHSKEPINYDRLITYFCYEFLSRVVLTDIKSPIYHKLLKDHRQALADYVQQELQEEVQGYDLFSGMHHYLCHPPCDCEYELLRAAHDYVSVWEFDMIYYFNRANPRAHGLQKIKDSLDHTFKQHAPLFGDSNLEWLASTLGQLRFQKRWTQTPRVPATSVLGHTLCVALCAFLLSFDLKACETMRVNHFLGGLFHDLPEILTRDIISPIKHGVAGLDSYLKELEAQAMEEIYQHVPSLEADLRYFTQREFDNRYKDPQTQEVIFVSSDAKFWEQHNHDHLNSVCGSLIKFCDQLNAFLEAKISIIHGISSEVLINGALKIKGKYDKSMINGVNLGAILNQFA
ncbi:HD domain-containing protein [Helicobacter bizzozeronii]|uniref:HD domain-containing protein n=1 Tax=Helicobacter bizzozeronii TaxID=56877 RepID=UPI000CF181A6